jgi:hypothetical protein
LDNLDNIEAWRDKCAEVAVLAGRCASRREFRDAPEPHRPGDIVQESGGEQGVVVAVAPGAVTWRSGPFVYDSQPGDLLLVAPAPADDPDATGIQAPPPAPPPMPWRRCLAISTKAATFVFAGAGAVFAIERTVDWLAASLGVAGTLAVAALALVVGGAALVRAVSRRIAAGMADAARDAPP